MATKSNESININRAAMVTFSEYLRKLTADIQANLDSISKDVNALANEDDGPIGGRDLEQTRNMYATIGVNLVGAANKLKSASEITDKFIDVQQAVKATGVKSTEELHQAAVTIAKKLKTGNSMK